MTLEEKVDLIAKGVSLLLFTRRASILETISINSYSHNPYRSEEIKLQAKTELEELNNLCGMLEKKIDERERHAIY